MTQFVTSDRAISIVFQLNYKRVLILLTSKYRKTILRNWAQKVKPLFRLLCSGFAHRPTMKMTMSCTCQPAHTSLSVTLKFMIAGAV